MNDSFGIKVDQPDATGAGGTTTTGNVCRRLFDDPIVRNVLLSLVPEHRRANLKELFIRVSVVLRVISSSRKIKVDDFKSFTHNTYIFLLDNWPPPICYLSPSAHKLLAHTAEFIENNDGEGLGKLSEGGLEAANKLLRRFRIHLSRKTSQTDNLVDCINRLWTRSDPILNVLRMTTRSRCQNCKEIGHSRSGCSSLVLAMVEEEQMVNNFFI